MDKLTSDPVILQYVQEYDHKSFINIFGGGCRLVLLFVIDDDAVIGLTNRPPNPPASLLCRTSGMKECGPPGHSKAFFAF